MSKPSIRQLLHPQGLLQSGERLDPSLTPVLAPEPVLIERQPGVSLGQLPQAALVATLGGPDLDR